ncbi:MAG: hypothetical protein IJ933_01785 [Bacteroidales bacterium]|nr:hypothetical protein [Bacteroidales bacterium]
MNKINAIILSLFAAVIYVCYGVVHPEWFNYHEQYQLFMFGWDYLSEHLSYASGLTEYVSEFLVQFYMFPYAGAAIWAGLLVLIGWMVWRVARIFDTDSSHLPLSLLPSVLLAVYCGDQYVMMAFPVALIVALAFVLVYNRLPWGRRGMWQVLLLPLVYWIVGYGVFVYAVLCLAIDRRRFSYDLFRTIMYLCLYTVELVFVIIIVGYTVMRQYPFIDIVCGVNYYRERLVVPSMQHVVAASVIIVPLVMGLLRSCGRVASIVEGALMVMVFPLLMPVSHDKNTYSLLKIDYLVRIQDWDAVIDYCEKNPPINDMACTGLNLALAMKGQLPERMFEFPQYGQNGLISMFARDMVSCGITAEACYYLGLINSVLRYNYDTQAAIINCNMSGRFTRRIAEAYMLDGNYELARKYADMLRKTLYYRSWAGRLLDCCDDPSLIAQNKRRARILRFRLPKDQLFLLVDMDEMFSNLYKHCPENVIALQYSLACSMLNVKMQNFVMAMSQVKKDERVPKAYQEALAYVYLSNTGTLQNMPDFISKEVKDNLAEFNRLMTTNPNHPNLHKPPLLQTYWHYVVFGRGEQ